MSDEEQGETQHPMDVMANDLRLRQRNIIFPDSREAGRDADALLWKGSDKLPGVQRVGIAIFGLFFVVAAVVLAAIAAEGHSILGALVSIGFLCVGARVLFNSIPKRKSTK
jgi:Flp pilus assembly protein TadB